MERCPYSKKCSGCQLQNLIYKEQLQMKQVKMIRLLGRFCHVKEIIGMETPFNYRNKSQYAFTYKNGRILSGIYQSTTQKIVEVKNCMLEDKCAEGIVQTVRRLLLKYKLKAYDLHTQKGFVRHVLVRKGSKSGEIMVVIVTADDKFSSKEDFTRDLTNTHKEITTVVWNVNPTNTPLFLGKNNTALYGKGYITDELCGLNFRISPNSFYQVNSLQAEVLYSIAKDYARLTGNETVLDAYCGTGTIGLTMANKAKRIIGVELNCDATNDAKANATLNHIENATFYNEDAGEFMTKLAKKKETIDVVIADPPRAGCSKEFLKSLVALYPKRVVYISCNPETLERDLFILSKAGYNVRSIQPVDMFPYTNHIECVVRLERKSN